MDAPTNCDLDGVLVDSEKISDAFSCNVATDGFAVDTAFNNQYFLGRRCGIA
jgi:beta-phosphoglucomutase-like phosphatase (HAD superfamily)